MPKITKEKTVKAPLQDQQPGIEAKMNPKPQAEKAAYKPAQKLLGKVALITGGDSGIGKAVAILFSKEGADIAIVYLNEKQDALDTKKEIEAEGRKGLLIAGDIKNENFCRKAVEETLKTFGKLNILVNNAAEQHPQESLEKITQQQLENTFKTNIFSMFYLSKAALKYLKKGDAIINTTSVTAYRGSEELIDYSSTKGAIVAFTRSLSKSLAKRNIRVNAVAPGPIWTPLIPSTFKKQKVQNFGGNVPMQRVGQPGEIAPSYVFLASSDSSYMTGQVLHPNGGEVINT